MKCPTCKGYKGVFGKSATGHPATLPCNTCGATGEIGENMKLFHVVINATPMLDTFSPIEVVELLVAEAKKQGGEIPVDVYTTEVK